MKLTDPQQTISQDDNRFRVVVAGRRFGKSYLSINEIAKFARKPNQKCLLVAPHQQTTKFHFIIQMVGLVLYKLQERQHLTTHPQTTG